MKSFLKWSGIFTAIIALLIGGFYLIENYRGAKVWEETRAFLESEGETLEFRELLPPLPPDEENFCAIPLIASMTDFEMGGGGYEVYLDSNHERIEAMKLPKPLILEDTPTIANLRTGDLPGFEDWAALLADAADFDPGPESMPAAQRVVKALSRFDREFDEMAGAAARQHAVWKFAWSDVAMERFSQTLPHYTDAVQLAKLLRLRAVVLLETGDSAAARQALAIMDRLAEAMENSPGLLSEMVAITLRGQFLSAIWYGLRTERWGEDDLAWLAGKLDEIDVFEWALFAFRSEMATSQIGLMNHLKNASLSDAAKAFTFDRMSDGSLIEGLNLMLCPDGWWDRNKSDGCRMVYEQAILPLKKRDLSTLGPSTLVYHSKRPYSMLLRISFPAYVSMLEKVGEMVFYFDAARVAVALERYRGTNGSYPKDLKALVPEFLNSVPADPMDGKPMKYLPGANGRYRIYSIGLDRFDDGGEVVFRPTGKTTNPDLGDWVWGFEFPERTASADATSTTRKEASVNSDSPTHAN